MRLVRRSSRRGAVRRAQKIYDGTIELLHANTERLTKRTTTLEARVERLEHALLVASAHRNEERTQPRECGPAQRGAGRTSIHLDTEAPPG